MVKWASMKEVDNFEYIFSMGAMASYGYPRSSIMASNLGWSMKPTVFCEIYYI